MTWKPPLVQAPPQAQHVWRDNAEIREVYLAHLKAHYSTNTYRGYGSDITVFLGMWDQALVTTLQQPDIDRFLVVMAPKCAKLQNGATPSCRLGFDMAGCPLLKEGVPYTTCHRYQPLDVMALWSYLRTIHSFYEWLRENGHIGLNPATGPMRRFRRRHKAVFDERRRKPRRRRFSRAELRKLLHGSPIQHAIMYVLMAKCFLRIHEVLKLSLAPSHCNLQEGWMDIPVVEGWPGKRQGNARIILDGEALVWINKYLDWRDEHVKRDPLGNPITERLCINQNGEPWALSAIANFRTAMQKDCRRVGLMTGAETERQDRFGPHGLRAFATKAARDRRANDAELQVMRGDVAPGAIDRYDEYLDRLPDLYHRLGPRIDE
jgi:site-specific recombinase XerC